MNLEIDKIIALVLIIAFGISLNLVNRITFKNPSVRKLYLQINRVFSFSKDGYIYLTRAIVYLLIILVILAIQIIYLEIPTENYLIQNNGSAFSNIVALLLTIIVNMKMFFITSVIIISLILKKDLNKVISGIKWIEKNNKFPTYTKGLRGVFIAIIESVIFLSIFSLVINIVIKENVYLINGKVILTAICLSFIYGLGKSFLVKKSEEKMLMFLLGFWCCFTGYLIYGFTGNIIYTSILFIITISFWVFKI